MMESPDALSAEASELFRFFGGDGEDEDTGDEGQEDADQDSNAGDEDESEQDQDGDDTPTRKPAAKKQPASKGKQDDDEDEQEDPEEQLARLKRENIRLKKAAEKKEEDGKADKDKDKTITKLTTKNKQLERVVATTFIEHAIMKISGVKDKDGNPRYDWHDIDDVRAAIQTDAIDINLDTGEVDGLDIELKRIAKKKPHYLRGSEGEQEEEQENQGRGRGGRQNPGRPRSTGGHPYGGRTRSGKPDEEKLKAKYKIGSQFVGGTRIG